jgi:hypothetical protein
VEAAASDDTPAAISFKVEAAFSACAIISEKGIGVSDAAGETGADGEAFAAV